MEEMFICLGEEATTKESWKIKKAYTTESEAPEE